MNAAEKAREALATRYPNITEGDIRAIAGAYDEAIRAQTAEVLDAAVASIAAMGREEFQARLVNARRPLHDRAAELEPGGLVPEFTTNGLRALQNLLDRGYEVTGLAVEQRSEGDESVGIINSTGAVYWII
ncbi:hypothetical protein FDI24_gp015 [Acidovorax phage ACP17]|uniref:Uncharacterized protein n=1 Tax=Acidovorax phage ACP17 TaxID=2010329 RepID=A0A218M3D8_9CAUD|nr:hypothetical protein FDI24_gp015 [Acidovorax phage ACP17]ASD50549.1 hypothetical protein [Acidovorax phage ACP17]